MRSFYKYCALIVALLYCSAGFCQITLTSPEYLDYPATVIKETVKQENITSYYQINGLSSSNRITSYSYLDGFNRSLQNIILASTPAGYDIIQLFAYDDFGRQTKSYLPYQAATSDGSYYDRSTAISDQATFYTTNNTSNKITYEDKPYVQSEIEESPMQRLIKQGNIGDGFQTNQNYKTMDYRANTSGDAVKKWSNSGTTSSTYSAGELNVAIGTDENGYETRMFADRSGRMILKRQQADETIGGNFYAWFDTYYVYDNLGNIIYVVPPKAVYRLGVIGGTWNVTSVPDLTYSYIYDYKNRVTQKKVPNAAVIYMVYDPLDRVVLVQDGNLRANDEWFFNKYDNRGRTAYEGIYTNTSITTLSGMQSLVDGQSCYTSGAHYEGRTTSSSFQYYTNTCFPTFNASPTVYYYYDDYDFDNDGNPDAGYQTQSLTGEIGATSKTSGLLTGTRKVVMGTSTYLLGITFYDKWYNAIQTWENSLLTASFQLRSAVFDFGGRMSYSKELSSAGTKLSGVTHSKLNSYTYDKMGRLLEVTQSNDGGTAVLVGHYEYNPLGQLVDKKLHSTNSGSTYLQSVDYRYNSRGQVTSINNSALNNDSGVTNDESNDVFGMTLLYDQSDSPLGSTGTYTGMLSAVKWKTVSPAVTNERAYIFLYDKISRLNVADYREYNGSNWNTLNYQGYNEGINYDWNGNIKGLSRSAVISGTPTVIDDLAYNYGANDDNNQLQNITESSSNSYGYRNFTSSSSAYSYDANGNLTTDPKKGVTITYNELNKPAKVREIASPNKYVEYRYDGLGNIISRAVFTGSLSVTTTTYSGSFTYEGATLLKEITMPEGRVRYASSVFTFEYFITDQQGNVRASFEDGGGGTAALRQENSYYPFGMSMNSNYLPGSSDNKNLYNAGSQFQDEFGGIIDYYNTFYRQYDPILGRFNGVDPQSEATVELSVYHYSGNNPVNFNDPMGNLKSVDVNGNWWHHPTVFAGTLFENNVRGPDGSLYPYEEVGDWFDALHGGYWVGDDNGTGPGGTAADIIRNIKEQINKWDRGAKLSIRSGKTAASGFWLYYNSSTPGTSLNPGNVLVTAQWVLFGSTIPVGQAPVYLGYITVMDNRNYASRAGFSDGVTRYMQVVELNYKDNNSGYTNLGWVQTGTRVMDAQGQTSTFTDPSQDGVYVGDNYPFYYNKSESHIVPGYDESFYDSPGFKLRPFTQTISCQLSLVGKKDGRYSALITLQYGFNLSSGGQFLSTMLVTPTTPSAAQNAAIQSLNQYHH